jgi:sulfoxide reductase heme-binding subunit YedZ
VYASASLGVVHYWWLVKADVRRPVAYGIVVALLLAFRVLWARLPRSSVRRAVARST